MRHLHALNCDEGAPPEQAGNFNVSYEAVSSEEA